MAIPLVPLIAAAPSIIKGIGSLFGIGKGNARAKRNIRPTEQVNPLYAQNAAMAENMARTGLPQEQLNLANQGIQRNLSSGVRSLGRSANPSAGLASIVRAGNDAVLNLNAQNSQARMNNQRFAFGQRAQLAGEQNRVWDWNNRQRFNEEANAAAQQIGAGKQNGMNALSELATLGQAFLGSQEGNNNGDNGSFTQRYNRNNSWGRRAA